MKEKERKREERSMREREIYMMVLNGSM